MRYSLLFRITIQILQKTHGLPAKIRIKSFLLQKTHGLPWINLYISKINKKITVYFSPPHFLSQKPRFEADMNCYCQNKKYSNTMNKYMTLYKQTKIP